MNIHEHQTKMILKDYGAPVSNGVVLYDKNKIKNEIYEKKNYFNRSRPNRFKFSKLNFLK